MAILFWVLFYLVVIGVTALALGGMFVQFFQSVEALEQAGASATMEDFAPLLGFYGVFIPLAIVVSSVIYGAVNRAVLRPTENALGYLRFGADELRIIAVTLILTLLFIALVFGLALVVGVIAGVLSAVAGDVAVWITIPAIIAVYAGIIWVAVRFSLAIPITVAERRIAVFESWRLTRGNFWNLFGMLLLSAVMAIVVYFLFAIVAAPIFYFALGGFDQLQALEGMAPVEIMTTMAPFAIAALIFYALVNAVMSAIMYAPYASAYLGLTGRNANAGAPASESGVDAA